MNKTVHVLKAVASAVVPGLGQVFNKQYWKALVFFFLFALVHRRRTGVEPLFHRIRFLRQGRERRELGRRRIVSRQFRERDSIRSTNSR
ncbi:MAG: DUF5683 domain-containing protein [Bacillus subtilis]|nr:DUF5683 domain-containing protein [Bacillus subtilis]